jgi:biotin carboxyl carrier protein
MPAKHLMRNNLILKTLLLICSTWLFAATATAAPVPDVGSDKDPLLESLDGKFTPGSLLVGKTRPDAVVRLDGRRLRITPDGYFVFGFGRDAEGLVGLSLKVNDREESHVFRLRERDWPVQKIEGVPERTVEPPEGETLKRIRRETAAVQAARARESDLKHFLDSFRWPLHGPVTGVYGSQRIYNGEPGRPHYGVDIARPAGTPVRAPNAGEVVLAHPNMFYSGGTMIIDHGYGVTSTFIHLKELKVEKGDQVRKGQVVGTVGSSGRATGAHLDWRINWYQTRIDPQALVGDMVERYRSASNAEGD